MLDMCNWAIAAYGHRTIECALLFIELFFSYDVFRSQ